MKLKPKLTVSTDLTAEEVLTRIPEITMRQAENERPMLLATHKVKVDTVGGFELKVSQVI